MGSVGRGWDMAQYMSQNFGNIKLGEPQGPGAEKSQRDGGDYTRGAQDGQANSENALIGSVEKLLHKLEIQDVLRSLEQDLQQLQQSSGNDGTDSGQNGFGNDPFGDPSSPSQDSGSMDNLLNQLSGSGGGTDTQQLQDDLTRLLQLLGKGDMTSGQNGSDPGADNGGAPPAYSPAGSMSQSDFGSSSPWQDGGSMNSLLGQQFGSGGGGVDTQKLEEDLTRLLQLLGKGDMGSGQNGFDPGTDKGGAPPAYTPGDAPPAYTPGGAPPASGDGQTVNIDGGNASGHGVTEEVDNNTGKAAKFGWENSQGKLVGELDLSAGAKGSFDVNADGPDGKSSRLIKLNDDGTIPQKSNLSEHNVEVGKDGSVEDSPDVSRIDALDDKIQIAITDKNGKTEGDGQKNPSYKFSTQDQDPDPNTNPMSLALDTSRFFKNDFTTAQ